jgi:SAM-dependent methyltransferase
VKQRAAIVRIIDHGASTTVIGPRGALRFDGDSAQLLRAVLEIHARPTTRDQLLATLAERSGSDVPTTPVDELLALLVRDGVLVDAREPALPQPGTRAGGRRVVLGISGAIAAVDAPVLIRGLHALGCDVRVALTETAQRFVAIDAIEALCHHKVWRSLWPRTGESSAPGSEIALATDGRIEQPVPHINLAEWAELVIVWPATASTIARIATGDCSELVAAIVTATRAPVIVAPSMNDAMLGSPAVQDNLETLRAHRRFVVHGTLGIEVAHRPEDRLPMFGPAAPPAAMLDIVRHLLIDLHPRPRLPEGAAAWERLWSSTPVEQLPWTHDPIDAPLAAALDRLGGRDKRMLDLGTGTGTVAIEAARRGFRVTATEISASALAHARDASRAAGVPVLCVLDDAIASHVDGDFDVVVDRGLLHCLPPSQRPAYAEAVTARTRPGGTLLVVVHQTGELATHPLKADELRALLPAFELESTTATTLSGGAALLCSMRRR